VLLVEAGPDYGADNLPPDVADASQPTTSHDWGLATEPDDDGRTIPVPRGRLVGGCGAINAGFVLRGWPSDFDEWAVLGNIGWSYADLLPTFRAVEHDLDFTDEWHGTSGPIPVSRVSDGELAPLQRAFVQAAVACGHRRIADHNRPGEFGIGPLPRNVENGVRLSTALTHLEPVRNRTNLTVRPDTTVDRVVIDCGRATGVRLVDGTVIAADRVVLSAGSYCSPAILLRSGIGPSKHLADLDIAVVVDSSGVGSNLIDHPLASIDLPTSPGYVGPRFQATLSMRSSLAAPDGPPDLHVFPAGPFDAAGGGVFGLVMGLLKPVSRGSVMLRSSDPAAPPRIDCAHLRHSDDMARMVDAFLEARRLCRQEALSALLTGVEITPGPSIDDHDRAAIESFLRHRVGTYHHPVGSCAMGPDPATGAVVDRFGAVHGVANLTIADASVMPTIPAANTNLTVIVIAERIASAIS